MAEELSKKVSVRSRPIALDPFFLFTYSLLALTGVIQVFLMVWMDIL